MGHKPYQRIVKGINVSEELEILGSEDNKLKVALFVWNPSTLEWERMKQPVLETQSANLYLAMDETEALLSEHPQARNNTSVEYHYDAEGNLDWIKKTVQGTVYKRTFTYTGGNLTGMSAWVEQ